MFSVLLTYLKNMHNQHYELSGLVNKMDLSLVIILYGYIWQHFADVEVRREQPGRGKHKDDD